MGPVCLVNMEIKVKANHWVAFLPHEDHSSSRFCVPSLYAFLDLCLSPMLRFILGIWDTFVGEFYVSQLLDFFLNLKDNVPFRKYFYKHVDISFLLKGFKEGIIFRSDFYVSINIEHNRQ